MKTDLFVTRNHESSSNGEEIIETRVELTREGTGDFLPREPFLNDSSLDSLPSHGAIHLAGGPT